MRQVTRLLLVCAILALAAPAFAQSSAARPAFNKEGAYAGLSLLPRFTFDDDDFDGQSTYREVDGDELEILPKVSTSTLTRVLLGFRTKRVGLEASYDHSRHDGTFLDATGRTTFQALNFDGRYFFLPHQRIQPFVQIGGSMPRFTVEDGSLLNDEVADAKFKGLGFHAQGGVLVYPHRQVGVSVGYQYNRISFETVKGVSGTEFDLIPKFLETRGLIVISGHVIF